MISERVIVKQRTRSIKKYNDDYLSVKTKNLVFWIMAAQKTIKFSKNVSYDVLFRTNYLSSEILFVKIRAVLLSEKAFIKEKIHYYKINTFTATPRI